MIQPDARTKLLDAAIDVIRAQGYCATTVDDLCRAAGVTKGAFFHHFTSKDAMAVAAAQHWTQPRFSRRLRTMPILTPRGGCWPMWRSARRC